MSKKRVSVLDVNVGRLAYANALTALAGFVVIGLGYMLLKPWLGVDYNFTAPWSSHGSLWEGLSSVWFIFVWGAGITLLLGLSAIIKETPTSYGPGEVFKTGTALSLVAGFFEEIIYRWLALFGSMIVIMVLNYFPFFGLLGWLYGDILVPLTNWASFGLLESQLYGGYGWLFAAGIVSANMRFQSGHEYQGFFGWVNAWYIGLFLFYLMFTYGLWTAIVAHILYDLCIFWMRGITVRFQPMTYGRLRRHRLSQHR